MIHSEINPKYFESSGTSRTFSPLDWRDSPFSEEENYLDFLPLNAEGLSSLLDYISQYDSFAAYQKLFMDFCDLLDDSLYQQMHSAAERLFVEELQQILFEED